MNREWVNRGWSAARVTIINSTKQTTVGGLIECAASMRSRMVGLLGRDHLEAGGGLLILPSSGIHTWGMRFAIDVVALDSTLRVVAIRESLGPFRIAALNWRTRSVLELPVGAVRASRIEPGDQLAVVAAWHTLSADSVVKSAPPAVRLKSAE